jgi:hypothetical protein
MASAFLGAGIHGNYTGGVERVLDTQLQRRSAEAAGRACPPLSFIQPTSQQLNVSMLLVV